MPTHPVTRREFLRQTAGAAAAAAVAQSSARGAPDTKVKRPSLLVLCSDQQHWQAMGHVDRFFRTPAMDALAAGGVSFRQAFCTTPQCSPSRSSLLTGLYPSKTGVWGNVGSAGGGELHHKTIGARLQEAGYHTGFFGKWHLGNDPVGNAGWDEESRKSRDSETTRLGLDFLKRHADDEQPFALFLMYLDPHDVYHFRPGAKDVSDLDVPLSASWHRETFAHKPKVQKRFMTDDQGTIIWGREQPIWEEYRDFYRGKVELVDQAYASVLETLESVGLADQTVVAMTSDHGDMDTNHKLVFKGPFMYEHMIRVPLLFRVPEAHGGQAGGRVADHDAVLVDVAPTLLDFAGAENVPCDGHSLKPILTGKGTVPSRDYVISQYYGKQQWVNPIRTIRTHDYKFNRYIEHGDELYDLRNDPEELDNLAGDAKATKFERELTGLLNEWIKANDDPFYSFTSNDAQKPPLPKALRYQADAPQRVAP